MVETVVSELSNPAYQLLLLTIFVAGIVRGFSGFGTGMIIAPVGSFLFSPKLVVVIIIIVDIWPVLPLVPNAIRKANWRELTPVVAGIFLGMPLGVFFLKYGDAITLRWFICVAIFCAVAILWSGWIYKGPRSIPISLSVGAMCGFMGASTQLTGPPAIIYWMASTIATEIIRANMMMMLFLAEFINGGGMWLAGIVTTDGVVKGLIASPFYLAGLLIGSAFFGKASEQTYRNIAFVLILFAAIISLPILDNVLR